LNDSIIAHNRDFFESTRDSDHFSLNGFFASSERVAGQITGESEEDHRQDETLETSNDLSIENTRSAALCGISTFNVLTNGVNQTRSDYPQRPSIVTSNQTSATQGIAEEKEAHSRKPRSFVWIMCIGVLLVTGSVFLGRSSYLEMMSSKTKDNSFGSSLSE
jgi:hypothetical protein